MSLTTTSSEGQARRGLVAGLGTPVPLASSLPSVLQEDDFCTRMTTAFDDSLAPILSTLDCLTAYLDPGLAPPDFLDWLASWVGLDLDETWPTERRRMLVREAIDLYRIRGTVAGLARLVELYADATPDIQESGGCNWSQQAGSPLPGSADPQVVVRLQLAEQGWVETAVVARIVHWAARPAHVPQRVEVQVGDVVVSESLEQVGSTSQADGAEVDDGGGGGPHMPEASLPPESESVEVGPGLPEALEHVEEERLDYEADQEEPPT